MAVREERGVEGHRGSDCCIPMGHGRLHGRQPGRGLLHGQGLHVADGEGPGAGQAAAGQA